MSNTKQDHIIVNGRSREGALDEGRAAMAHAMSLLSATIFPTHPILLPS